MRKLERFGLTEMILKSFEEKGAGNYLGRVILENRGLYRVVCEKGEVQAEIKGKLKYDYVIKSQYPAVGDWVVLDRETNDYGNAIISEVLPRASAMKRKAAGKELDEQIIGANIDVIFICMSLNNDFNLNRLDRYIVIAWDSGATPVVILTKADLVEDDQLEDRVAIIRERVVGTEVLVTSSFNNEGKDEILKYIRNNKTGVFVGSSGVGKSSLLNMILGEQKQEVQGLRNDDKGRHTTTHRELFLLEDGGIVIDTPGMREIQIDASNDVLESTFDDIEELMTQCKFKDCGHKKDLGCAVKAAIKNGTLSRERYEGYLKMKKEVRHMENKLEHKAALEEKRKDYVRKNRKEKKHKQDTREVIIC